MQVSTARGCKASSAAAKNWCAGTEYSEGITTLMLVWRVLFVLLELVLACSLSFGTVSLSSSSYGEACPTLPSRYGILYSTARDCDSPLLSSLPSSTSPPPSSASDSFVGGIWDVPVPSLVEKMYGVRRHHQNHELEQHSLDLTPMPAFAFITATLSAAYSGMYHQTASFSHAQSVLMDESSSTPDLEVLRLGSQVLSLYYLVHASFNFEDLDQYISSMTVCMRRMLHGRHHPDDANVSSSSAPFRPPASFTCLPLHEQTMLGITNKFREKMRCDQYVSHVSRPSLAPIQWCKVAVKFDVLLPLHLLPPLPAGVTFEIFTYAEITFLLPDSRLLDLTPSRPLFFDIVHRSARLQDSSSFLPHLRDAASLSLSAASSPRIHVPRSDSFFAYFIDSVYVEWPLESCDEDVQLVEAFDGHRVCAHSDGSNRARPRWMIFRTSGDVWTGLGMVAAVTAEASSVGGDVMVFDCTATVAQRAWNGGQQRVESTWQWNFYPWCLPSSFSHVALHELVFTPASTLNWDYYHLQSNIPLHEVLESSGSAFLLQRMRGTLSLQMALALLNESSSANNSSSTIMLDCGCCGWTTLLAMADELIPHPPKNKPPFSKEPFEFRTIVARLPLLESKSLFRHPASKPQWTCLNVSGFVLHGEKDGEYDRQTRGLRQVMSRIRSAFKIVSWDRLSAEELRVTFVPRASKGQDISHDSVHKKDSFQSTESFASAAPSQMPRCAIGDVDVCNVPGCSSAASAEECLSPKMLDYVKTIMKVCILRRRSIHLFQQEQSAHFGPENSSNATEKSVCSGLQKLGVRFVMKVKDDSALVAIIVYATKHDKFSVHDQESISRGALVVDIAGGGLGNVFQALFAPALMAINDGRQFFVNLTASSLPRYSGYITCAIDALVQSEAHLWDGLLGTEWHVRNVLRSEKVFDYMRCVWGVNETSYHGAITIIENGFTPFTLTMNEKFRRQIEGAFGVDADFYLSHFLVSPVAEFRQRATDSMAGIRSKYEVVIGVHMRWIIEGSHFLLPEDLDWFLYSAQKLAMMLSPLSVAFYVASDSNKHAGLFASGISSAAASSGGGGRVNRDWAVFTAEVFNNSTDCSTADSLLDLMMLSLSDHLIGTEFSTFTSLAAALGAHRPVIVGARAAQRFGRNKVIRVSHSSPIRADNGFTPFPPPNRHFHFEFYGARVDANVFAPMFYSAVGFMNASYHLLHDPERCRPDFWENQVIEARRWYENLYDVL